MLHKLSLLAKIKRYLRDDTALSKYKSMFLLYFYYADVIFDNAWNKDISKLQKVQNKCLKICKGKDRLFNTDLIHKLSNVPFLRDRREAHILNVMYNRKQNVQLLNNSEIRTRAHDAQLFEVSVPRCEAFKRSVGYFGAVKWNKLAPAVRNTDTFLAFKNLQKIKMLNPLSRIRVE